MRDDQDPATRDFVRHRDLLFSIVYAMLGSVADTEDVLRETWLAWVKRGGDPEVDNPRAYLARIAVNQALVRGRVDRTGAARRRRLPLVQCYADHGPGLTARANRAGPARGLTRRRNRPPGE
jgi:DNA-directed RNA polymerase specialized sigma24 family protein